MKIAKKRIGYGVLLLFLGVCFTYFQSYAMLATLIFFLILPLVTIWLCRVAFSGLSFSIEITGAELEKNLEFPVVFHIKNNSFVPILDCTIQVEWENRFGWDRESASFSVPVYARGEQIVRIPVKSAYSGVVTFRVSSVRIHDYLCLYACEKPVGVTHNVTIFPLVKEGVKVDTNDFVSGSDDAEESQTKGSDFSEVSNVREYIPGDSLKDIHWKLSVKQSELMVKEHVSMSAKQIAILVELYNDKDFVIDKIMEQAYSAAKDLVQTNRAFTLYWWSVASNTMKAAPVLGVGDLDQAFHEILFEQPYGVQGKGLEEFRLTNQHLERIFWVHDGKELEQCEVDSQ